MFSEPPVTDIVYPPAKAPVTRNDMVPEAVPLLARSSTNQYPPATLVRVMFWPTESCIFCEWM